jgi:hypothetical protein
MARIPIKRMVMDKGDALNEKEEGWLRENVQSFERLDWDMADEIDMDVQC